MLRFNSSLSFSSANSASSYNSVNIIIPLVWISTEFLTGALGGFDYGFVVATVGSTGGCSKACFIWIALVNASAVSNGAGGPVLEVLPDPPLPPSITTAAFDYLFYCYLLSNEVVKLLLDVYV